MQSYCLKTRKQEDIFECKVVQNAKGGFMLQGVTKDGYKTSKIISKVDAEKFINEGLANKAY